ARPNVRALQQTQERALVVASLCLLPKRFQSVQTPASPFRGRLAGAPFRQLLEVLHEESGSHWLYLSTRSGSVRNRTRALWSASTALGPPVRRKHVPAAASVRGALRERWATTSV